MTRRTVHRRTEDGQIWNGNELLAHCTYHLTITMDLVLAGGDWLPGVPDYEVRVMAPVGMRAQLAAANALRLLMADGTWWNCFLDHDGQLRGRAD